MDNKWENIKDLLLGLMQFVVMVYLAIFVTLLVVAPIALLISVFVK